MRSLTKIKVEFDNFDSDPNHTEITVCAPCVVDDLQAFGYPSTQEILDGAAYVAGVLGRLALAAFEDVLREGEAHQCHGQRLDEYGYRDGTCHLSCTRRTIVDPADDTGSPPMIWLAVPRKNGAKWVKRIQDCLEVITHPTRVEDEPTLRAIPGGQP